MKMKHSKTDYLTGCGILPKWHDKTLDQFTNDPVALETIKTYLKDPPKFLRKGVGLYLYGANGVGKTHLLATSFMQLIDAGYKCRIISPSTLIQLHVDSWYNNERRAYFKEMIYRNHFLAIEDFNTEFRSSKGDNSDGANENLGITALDNLLRVRSQLNLPTWVTSNLKPSEVKTKYSENIASLLKEMTVQCQVMGKDYRETILKQNKNELRD